MSTAQVVSDFESAPLPPAGVLSNSALKNEKESIDETVVVTGYIHSEDGVELPTAEEMLTLRKVPAPMPWPAVAMCLIELAERASYYGCTGVFGNFVRGPLPDGGPGTGAVAPGAAGLNQSAGALGLGSVAASACTNTFTFLAYLIPILGGIISDTKWGRFKTIAVGAFVGGVAHVLLIIPAIPSIIAGGNALSAFLISMIILAFASGFIKPCLGPLLCDQSPVKQPTIQITKSGERVILDPQATVQRYLLIFYWCINVGAFFAVATAYAERLVGYWLAYLLPGIIYMLMPLVLVVVYKRLYKAPPQGSVVFESIRASKYLFKDGGLKRMWKGGDQFWERAKPSYIQQATGELDLDVVFWDDKFVDELKASISACACFLLIPIFNLADGGLGNPENAMSSAMTLAGAPNTLVSNLNPLSIVICTPILTFIIYPFLAKRGYPIRPMTRMAIGFTLAGINMVYGAVLQYYVYKTSPCGYYATSDCADVSPLSIWYQVPLYSLPAVGEIFVNVTSYELAYSRAPARMKGLIYACALFTSSISSAIGLALSAVVTDPYLIWSYVALAAACFICAGIYPTYFKHLNTEVVFNDHERMEGLQQPRALAAAAKLNGSEEATPAYVEKAQ